MGDGGVSCVPPPLQLSQLVNFALMEDKLCGGSSTDVAFSTSNNVTNSNGRETNVVSTCNTSSSNGIVTQKTTVVTVTADGKRKVKKIIRKVKKKVAVFKVGGAENGKGGEGGVVVSGKKELTTYQRKKKISASSSINVVGSGNSSVGKENGEEKKHELGRDETGNGEVVVAGGEVKDEVEEGELGTLENGESAPKGATTIAGNELDKWKKGDVDKGDLAQERSRNKEFGSWKGSKDGLEKGEFVPDRWQQKDDYSSHGRMRPHESSAVKDKGWRCDRDSERTPPSGGKYNSSDDSSQRKEFIRSGSSQHSKRPASRWDPERDSRVGSKMGYEENSYKNEHFSGRDYSSGGNRLKRYSSNEVDISEHKLHGDVSDYATGLKSRRISDDGSRTANSEHFSRQSVDRPHRNSSSKISSSDRYAPSHFDSSRSSKVVYDRHGHSPGRSDWSPHEKVRYHDNYDRSPVHKDRSPYARWERSPYDRRDRSPYDWKERSPYDRREKSPYDHDRREKSPYDRRDRSPYDRRERSPYDRRERSPYDRRERSPYARREKSPYDGSLYNRSRHDDFRNRSPNNAEHSPQSRPRRSPLDRHKPSSCCETVRKIGASEKRHRKLKDEKVNHTNLKGKDSQMSSKECQGGKVVRKGDLLVEDNTSVQLKLLDQNQSLGSNCKESIKVNGLTEEEPPSMEEDMDICDTPPHVTRLADSNTGRWYYLDHLGVEQGPSKLSELKALMEEGALVSDHLIKHLESDRWVTIENASSPLVIVNFPRIVPDIITQLVTPPEAPGNLLVETEDSGKHYTELTHNAPASTTVFGADESSALYVPLEDLHIDQRVDTLLEGVTVIPGREIEILGEALQMTFELPQWEKVGFSEGSPLPLAPMEEQESGLTSEEASEYRAVAPFEMDIASASGYTSGWFSGQWSCKGGDWKRNDDAVPEKSSRKKVVLNDGFPLCKMPKSGSEDPRVHKKEELYYPSQQKRLDLPCWSFSFSDDKADSNVTIKSGQANPAVKGVRGTMLPVVRINACVVKSNGSFVSEARPKPRARDKYSSRSSRSHSVANDTRSSSAEVASSSKIYDDHESKGAQKQNAPINHNKDRLCNSNDLQLHVGGWYYLDGAGHEKGPLSASELQVLVDEAHIQRCSSVFRKYDNIWVPLSAVITSSNSSSKCLGSNSVVFENSSQMQDAALHNSSSILSLFHRSHPQFIGYALGRLHELVMKSYRSREFAASINKVLDPWISDKQPKKEMDKHIFNPSSERSSPRDSNRLWRSESDHGGKRARVASDGSDKDDEIDGDLMVQQDDPSFEDLCGNVTFKREDTGHSLVVRGSWGLLDGHMLARVFHFLRADVKSLSVVALTCKHWRSVVGFYKGIANQVDLSPFGPICTGSMISNIMRGYNREKITSVVLAGCTNVTSTSLEEILHSYPSLSLIDIRGCSRLEELCPKFPNVQWIKSHRSRLTNLFPESNSKLKSVKQITQKMCDINKGDADPLRAYFDSVERRESASQSFRQSLYQRSKVFDARKSSSILSRDARLRRWAVKKTEVGYKKMESTIAVSLKDIMKENTFDFFVPKVAEIEEKMKNGYYNNRGLSSVKEDIRRMCRDALKVKNRGEAGDMNHVVTSFIELATRLEDNQNSWNKKNMKTARDNSSALVLSDNSKYKKKLSKLVTDRKYGSKNSGEEFASDREVNRRLSKLNKTSMDSGSDTSDEFDRSSDDANSETESTASDTESDADLRADSGTGESKAEGFFMEDEGVDFITDEREWGARMTKASLVPPITRKYEVIDHYVIVADEEEVRRKMKVSLPEDYAEKLSAEKSGSENLDMEIPEVKAYKPRKTLGDEVIEQEVYGIDPYTHNLLLDSMPEELLWTLTEKHAFIEDVLLAKLNKQAREFTGSGNTPMMYSLQPIVEEIQRTSEEVKDVKTMQMCQGILKAIANRPDDKYVAYRKGLGVVCNKDGGFSADDFVVEFLGEVYPAWRWFEKQDGIRSLQKNSKDPAPEFYNIYLERPKGDADGYDLVVVDAMHKANYASRICHSCHPNCEAKVTAVDGQYQIGIYAVREIQYGEEISFDYNSVTESKEEYEASVCLCGSQICRGSYLNLTGEGAFQKVLKDWHGLLDRYQLMIEACESNSVSEEDYIDLGKAGLGSCLLAGLPDWLISYSARLVRFINFERTKLPEEILRHNLEEKKKYFAEISLEVEKSDAEVQAEGVYNQRLQNLALTLDKVRYVMRCVFGDPKRAPPPLERLSPRAAASFLWRGEGSLVEELLQCIVPHMDSSLFNDLKAKVLAHDPLGSDEIHKELQRSLLWLRDEVRNLPCTYKCRHDAAADLIHIYAYTKCFFRIREYESVTSAPVLISPLDMGPKYAEKMGPGLQEYCKTYGANYCLGQLINWHNQTNADPDCSLVRASRGCLSLPEIGSFYARAQKPSRQRIYGPRTVRFMLSRMEKQPQKPWPKDLIWSFHDSPKVIGSPMLDSTLKKCPLSKEMVHWLKNRPAIFQAMWDR